MYTEYKSFVRICMYNNVYSEYFLSCYGLSVHFPNNCFWKTSVFNFDEVPLINFNLYVQPKKSLPILKLQGLCPIFSSNFMVLVFKTMIHFLVNFCMWSEVRIKIHFFLYVHLVTPASFIGRIFFFPLN